LLTTRLRLFSVLDGRLPRTGGRARRGRQHRNGVGGTGNERELAANPERAHARGRCARAVATTPPGAGGARRVVDPRQPSNPRLTYRGLPLAAPSIGVVRIIMNGKPMLRAGQLDKSMFTGKLPIGFA